MVHDQAKHQKLTAKAIDEYNLLLLSFTKKVKGVAVEYVPKLYEALRKYMKPKEARARLHTDTVDSGLISDRTFMVCIPDEAKEASKQHRGPRAKKTVDMGGGQSLQLEEESSIPSIEDDEGATDNDDLVSELGGIAAEQAGTNYDIDLPVVTEEQFLAGVTGSNPYDSTFRVGIRTVNFEIPSLDRGFNTEAQIQLHEAFKEVLVEIVRGPSIQQLVLGKMLVKMAFMGDEHEDIDIETWCKYTDMCVVVDKSVVTFDKIKESKSKEK